MNHVYFIRCESAAQIKIGVTNSIERSLATFATMTPLPVEVLACLPGGYDIERRLHIALAEYREAGEWFKECPEVYAMMERFKMGDVPPKPVKPKPVRKVPDDGRQRRAYGTVPIDKDAPANVIIAKFGGLAKFARAIGLASSTIHRWSVKGHIDAKYHALILSAAKSNSVKLKPIEFVDLRNFSGASA